MITTLAIQQALRTRGYDPGPADGALGPLTRAAIRAFEAANGLPADGAPDPALAAKLGLTAAGKPAIYLPWMAEARRLVGREEHRDRSEIAGWAGPIGLGRFDATTTSWCGLFVGHCIAAALPGEPLPANPLGARNWLQFGRPCEPREGAVMVFWREAVTGWKGHVAFYIGEDREAFHILGGNQSDAVTTTRIDRGRLLGARWPASAPLAGGAVQAGGGGALSQNEA